MLRVNYFRDHPAPPRVHYRANGPREIAHVHVRSLILSLLGDKVVDHILHFKKHSNNAFTEKMLSMTIWNP